MERFFDLCRSGSEKDVLKAIGRGADVNARDDEGNTALIFAVSERPNSRVVKVLLDNGADVNARNNDGLTALMFAAARTTRPDVITLLFNAGAEAEAALNNGWTALMFAAAVNPDPAVIQTLCQGRAQVNRRADEGMTALILAAERNPNADVVKELIRRGANVNECDQSGRTALIGAALRNSRLVSEPDPNPEVIDALLDSGAEVDAVWDGDRAIDIVRDSPYLRGTDTLTRLKALSARKDRTSLIDDFLTWLNVAKTSRHVYRKNLNCFFAWLDGQGIQRPKREHILAWRDELISGGRRPRTVLGYLTIVRQFFRWAHQKGLCGDIAENIKFPKREHAFQDDTLTLEQVWKMLDGIDRGDVEGLRDYAILSLMVMCGLGYGEVSRTRREDLVIVGRRASLRIRGANGGNVRLPAAVVRALREYLEARGSVKPDAPLFIGTHKQGPMSIRMIGGVVRRAALRSGIDKAAFTHNSLRHTAVKLALWSGARIEDVKKFARHRYIGTTYRCGAGVGNRKHRCEDTIASAIF